jgi:hypothetical protein
MHMTLAHVHLWCISRTPLVHGAMRRLAACDFPAGAGVLSLAGVLAPGRALEAAGSSNSIPPPGLPKSSPKPRIASSGEHTRPRVSQSAPSPTASSRLNMKPIAPGSCGRRGRRPLHARARVLPEPLSVVGSGEDLGAAFPIDAALLRGENSPVEIVSVRKCLGPGPMGGGKVRVSHLIAEQTTAYANTFIQITSFDCYDRLGLRRGYRGTGLCRG